MTGLRLGEVKGGWDLAQKRRHLYRAGKEKRRTTIGFTHCRFTTTTTPYFVIS
jgi:hypothetical protein